MADTALLIGPPPAAESYLRADAIVDAAKRSGAEAVHPGYGFLSERASFARACADAGLAFVGPPAAATEKLGDKVAAKQLAADAGVPTVPGIERPGLTDEAIVAWAQDFPLMVKAAAGGGGRGMRIVRAPGELPEALAGARREAQAGFGDDSLLAERYVERARHVEVQLLADSHGDAVHLGERECSLQRRHQKLIEECPSPAVSPELRERMGEAAVALARTAGYENAGTCEFLVSGDEFFFLELNARLQVEHPVTEMVCGLDLVEAQLRVAAGEPLWFGQDEVVMNGHAIEARVCAEDPAQGFLPGAGRIVAYHEPSGPGVRVDSGVELGSEVTTHYDSLLAKVIAHAPERELALDRLEAALAHTAVLGPSVNTFFLRGLLANDDVRRGEMDTGLVERLPAPEDDPDADGEAAAVAALARGLELAGGDDPWDYLTAWRTDGPAPLRWRFEPGGEVVARGAVEPAGEGRLAVTLDGERRTWAHARDGEFTRVGIGGRAWAFRDKRAELRGSESGPASLEAPMPGNVLAVKVGEGDEVSEGDVLVVLESMKMELQVVAPADGVVGELTVSEGDQVERGQALVEVS
jgi:acetyl-CoA/propionyl-CoA carboxylase biotin carboxyl carrier protein